MTEKKTRLRNKNRNESSNEEETIENEDTIKLTTNRKRIFSFKYSFYSRGNNVVCKTFFLNTLGISVQVVKTVFQKIGSTGVVVEIDYR